MYSNLKITKFYDANAYLERITKCAQAIEWLVKTLKEGEQSRVALEKAFIEKFDMSCPSATHVLDEFEQYGWVRSEVRAEETRWVRFLESGRYIEVKPNEDGTATVTIPYR